MSQRSHARDDDDASDNEPDTDTESLFMCRKCPGKTFTAAEKDAHRLYHKAQKEKEKAKASSKKPNSLSRARKGSSPVRSEITLFDPIESPSDESGRRRSPRKVRQPTPRTKIQSIKKYNTAVKSKKFPGN